MTLTLTLTTTLLIYTGTTLLWLWWGKWQNDNKNRLEKELRELRKNFFLYKSGKEALLDEMQKELNQLKALISSPAAKTGAAAPPKNSKQELLELLELKKK